MSSYSKRTYFYTSTFSLLYSHTVLMLSLIYASIQKKVNFLMVLDRKDKIDENLHLYKFS